MRILLLLFSLSLSNCITLQTDYFNCVQLIKTIDGDTFKVNISGLHPLLGQNISVRIKNYNAFELRDKDQAIKQKAIEQKEDLDQLLRNAKCISLHNVTRGKYFRIVADVYVDGVNALTLNNPKSDFKRVVKNRN